jgi:hypothetical protein
MRDLSTLTADQFEAHRGTAFSVEAQGGEMVLQLEGVERRAGAPQARAAFSVFWLGPAGSPFLAQGIRTLRHRELGEMELFLVPVEEVEGGVRYQAVFA